MRLLRQLRWFDFLLIASVAITVVAGLVTRSGHAREVANAIEDAAQASTFGSGEAADRAFYDLAAVIEDHTHNRVAPGVLRRFVETSVYEDSFNDPMLAMEFGTSEDPIIVALRRRLVELRGEQGVIYVTAPPPLDPAVRQGIRNGLLPARLILPDGYRTFPETFTGLADWQLTGSEHDALLTGDITFPPTQQRARITIGPGPETGYLTTISVTLSGSGFGNGIATIDLVTVGDGERPPIGMETELMGAFTFVARLPTTQQEAIHTILSEPIIYFDMRLTDGRRALIYARMRDIMDDGPTVFDQAFAAWGLAPAAGE